MAKPANKFCTRKAFLCLDATIQCADRLFEQLRHLIQELVVKLRALRGVEAQNLQCNFLLLSHLAPPLHRNLFHLID